jgi:predicted nucleic acid-binding protein
VISVDTSVVVRYIVGTPVNQAERAAKLLEGDAEAAISLVVIAETAHVLRTFYQLPRADIADVLLEFISKSNVSPIELSKADAIDALVRARAFASSPITDALIAATARARNALPVYTFDKKFGRLGALVATP